MIMLREVMPELAGPAGYVTLRGQGDCVLGYFTVVEGEADFDEFFAPFTEAAWRERDGHEEGGHTTADVLEHLRRLEQAS